MGKRKKRRRINSGVSAMAKPSKQPKIADFLSQRENSPVSTVNNLNGHSIGRDFSQATGQEVLDVLEWDLQATIEQQQLQDLSISLQADRQHSSLAEAVASPLAPLTAARGGLVKPPTNGSAADFMSHQCLLTAQTVLAIFEHLTSIKSSVSSLEEAFRVFAQKQADRVSVLPAMQATQSQELPANECVEHVVFRKERSQHNRILQTNQICLCVYLNRTNWGRWSTKTAIALSLSQLLQCQLIDLQSAVWLPANKETKRILLTFKQMTIPGMLFRKKSFLARFQIYPIQVFQDTNICPLFCNQRIANNILQNQKKDKQLTASNLENLSLPKNNPDKLTRAKGARTKEDALEDQLIFSFGVLPSSEQNEILQRLKSLQQTLMTTQQIAAPLIDLVMSPSTQDLNSKCKSNLQTPLINFDLFEKQEIDERGMDTHILISGCSPCKENIESQHVNRTPTKGSLSVLDGSQDIKSTQKSSLPSSAQSNLSISFKAGQQQDILSVIGKQPHSSEIPRKTRTVNNCVCRLTRTP